MIGRIFNDAGRAAILDDEGVWQCEVPELAEVLNEAFSPHKHPYCSPSMGAYGFAAVVDAAQAMKCEYELKEVVPEEGEGKVY